MLLKHLLEHKVPFVSTRNPGVHPTPPHLTDHYTWATPSAKHDVDLPPPLRPHCSFTPCPHLSPELSQHPVCPESHVTATYLHCQHNPSTVYPGHGTHQLCIFQCPNSHRRGFANCQRAESEILGPTSRESYLTEEGGVGSRNPPCNKFIR